MLKAADNRSPTCGKQSGKHVGKIEEKGKLTFLTPLSLWSDLWELPPNFIYWVTSRLNSNKQRPVRCQGICIEGLSFSPSSVTHHHGNTPGKFQWLKEVTVTIILLLHWGTSLRFCRYYLSLCVTHALVPLQQIPGTMKCFSECWNSGQGRKWYRNAFK